MQNIIADKGKKRSPYLDTIAFLALLVTFFGYIGSKMGISNMFSTIIATAYELLVDTVLYIMAIAVLAGAFGKLATEFGLVKLLNKIFSPLMRPLYNLPGVASLGIITTYLSDNPAIISLAKDDEYISYFEEYETPCLCNLGTSFGMGLIVTTFVIGLGYFKEAIVGNLGAAIGSIVSVRIMSHRSRKALGISKATVEKNLSKKDLSDTLIERTEGSFFERFLTAFLEGGKLGVDIGLGIIPGVLVICTIIMILTFGPLDPSIGYQGKAFEGVGLLPKIGEIIAPVSKILFGFERPEAIAFPVTALGAVGAALSLMSNFLQSGIIGPNEVAVFTAMGMCWSGFLSTHVAMLDALGHRKLISKAISSHFIGGVIAGISAHYILVLINFLSKLT